MNNIPRDGFQFILLYTNIYERKILYDRYVNKRQYWVEE